MEPTRRRPWLAAILSLLLAGLGHLYAGSLRRAAKFFGGEIAVMVAALFLLISWPLAPWNMIVGTSAGLIWRFVAAVSAVRLAARERVHAERPGWVRWPAYAAVYLVAHFGPALAIRAVAFEAFRLPTGAMSDTLLPGDRFLATKWNVGSPGRGEIVVFCKPADTSFVSRVIGLPGDRVEVHAGIASVNGNRLAEPYVRLDGTDRGDFGPTVVPSESYFVLGDRRNHSRDSRMEELGFVREDQIVARPRAIFWSRDPETGEIRWDRVGRPLR